MTPLVRIYKANVPEQGSSVLVTWTYDTDDPYMITLRFPNEIEWCIERSLVAYGLMTGMGDGDVRIHPLPSNKTVCIHLTGTTGQIRLYFSASQISSFMYLTMKVCQPGTETQYLEMPENVDQFLKMAGESWSG